MGAGSQLAVRSPPGSDRPIQMSRTAARPTFQPFSAVSNCISLKRIVGEEELAVTCRFIHCQRPKALNRNRPGQPQTVEPIPGEKAMTIALGPHVHRLGGRQRAKADHSNDRPEDKIVAEITQVRAGVSPTINKTLTQAYCPSNRRSFGDARVNRRGRLGSIARAREIASTSGVAHPNKRVQSILEWRRVAIKQLLGSGEICWPLRGPGCSAARWRKSRPFQTKTILNCVYRREVRLPLQQNPHDQPSMWGCEAQLTRIVRIGVRR